MKTILIFLILWIAFPALHSLLFVAGLIGTFLWIAVTLRQREDAQTSNWNGPNRWNR